jgi:hypothetical protein
MSGASCKDKNSSVFRFQGKEEEEEEDKLALRNLNLQYICQYIYM